MATWDSADLLARCKLLAARPAADQSMADADWYMFLTEAQRYWVGVISTMTPWAMLGNPTLMTTADGGLTYTFAGSITPLALEVYDALNGRILRPGAYWDPNCDYVWEASKIRFPRGAIRTYANGPYARYITPPTTIDAGTAPTLLPDHARILLVHHATASWARRGGLRDPAPFEAAMNQAWAGNPNIGDPGILGQLKMQNPFYGASSFPANGASGFAYIAQVEGYRV